MQRLKRNRHLRQRHMVYELSSTFLIKDREDTFTICNVILPNADQLERKKKCQKKIKNFFFQNPLGLSNWAWHLVTWLT